MAKFLQCICTGLKTWLTCVSRELAQLLPLTKSMCYFSVHLYKCEYLAITCGACALLDPAYRCEAKGTLPTTVLTKSMCYFSVHLYKCECLANTCGACTLLDPAYRCEDKGTLPTTVLTKSMCYFPVHMYKCEYLANTCGACTLLDPSYRCGWCEDRCTLPEYCVSEGDSKFLTGQQICPDPQIIKVSLNYLLYLCFDGVTLFIR